MFQQIFIYKLVLILSSYKYKLWLSNPQIYLFASLNLLTLRTLNLLTSETGLDSWRQLVHHKTKIRRRDIKVNPLRLQRRRKDTESKRSDGEEEWRRLKPRRIRRSRVACKFGRRWCRVSPSSINRRLHLNRAFRSNVQPTDPPWRVLRLGRLRRITR